MIPKNTTCTNCGADIEVSTYRKFVVCPYCQTKFDFEGFEYSKIDRSSSKYSKVKYEMDCPACRGKQMFLFTSKWKCEDCGYSISRFEKIFSVFWFCDECDVFLNVQENFSTKQGKWKCSECGHMNSTTKSDIL
ncbi:MAG: hypothetical protein IJO29_00875 [Oscillospiraceae bacterium]|nr:hypothetical protein [Oscillospiraceae bacterium]